MADPTAPTLEQVAAFLDGSAPLYGHWFGEARFGMPLYWWRSHLRSAINANAVDVARLQAENERLRKAAVPFVAALDWMETHWADRAWPEEDKTLPDYFRLNPDATWIAPTVAHARALRTATGSHDDA